MFEARQEDITFENLEYKYGTGRAYTISGTGRDRVTGYRAGVQTKLGDIEISEWMDLIRGLIERSGEQKLNAALVEWLTEHNYCRASKSKITQKALELHSMRIFDNPSWVDFLPFNERYRPEALVGVEMVDVLPVCCEKWGRVTKRQVENGRRASGSRVSCPICGRFTEYITKDGACIEGSVPPEDLILLPTADEIGTASVGAVRLVCEALLRYDLKYRLLDFSYTGKNGRAYNPESANSVRYVPQLQTRGVLEVRLSFKCKRQGKKLKSLVKDSAQFFVETGAKLRKDGIIFSFLMDQM